MLVPACDGWGAMGPKQAVILRALQQRGTKLASVPGETGADCRVLLANFKQEDALAAASSECICDMRHQRAFRARSSMLVIEACQPDTLGRTVQQDLLVGACQAHGEDGIDVAREGGTRAEQRQEIGLGQCPEQRILLGAHGGRGRLAREQRHLAEALAWPEPRYRERIGVGWSTLLIPLFVQQNAHLAGGNNVELPMPDIPLQDAGPARDADWLQAREYSRRFMGLQIAKQRAGFYEFMWLQVLHTLVIVSWLIHFR